MNKNKFTGVSLEKNNIKVIDDTLEFKMLSQGNTAEVYQYSDTEILKLFRENMPFELIKDEYETAGAASSKLPNVPKVFGIVLYKSRYGIIYEWINGDDLPK